jgi:cardiolipin synthase
VVTEQDNRSLTSETRNGQPGASRIVTIPNVLSASRLILLPVVLYFLFKRQGPAAVAVMAVSWSTDALDGYLARKLNQVSNVGKILDHVVDKVWVGSVLVSLVFLRGLPLAIAGAVILRDILILAGSSVLIRAKGYFVSSDVVGKITGCGFALMILYYSLDLPALARFRPVVDYGVSVLILVSFINYLTLYLRKMARFRLPGEEQQ